MFLRLHRGVLEASGHACWAHIQCHSSPHRGTGRKGHAHGMRTVSSALCEVTESFQSSQQPGEIAQLHRNSKGPERLITLPWFPSLGSFLDTTCPPVGVCPGEGPLPSSVSFLETSME